MRNHYISQTVQPSWPFASRHLYRELDNKQSIQPTYSDIQVKVEQETSNQLSQQVRVFGRVLIPSNLFRV